MASVTRRGFLQALGAAAVGAATFDPKSLLWVPGAPTLINAPLTPQQVERMLALDDLALQFAQAMAERLDRTPSVILRDVMYRYTGSVLLPPNILDIPETGLGRFTARDHRVLASGYLPTGDRNVLRRSFVEPLASQLASDSRDCDMYAPIGRDLRPGEPFSEGTPIGLATDPASGLSVRVLQGTDWKGRTITHFEMAGGRWEASRSWRHPSVAPVTPTAASRKYGLVEIVGLDAELDPKGD